MNCGNRSCSHVNPAPMGATLPTMGNSPRSRAQDTIRAAAAAYGEDLAFAVAEDSDVADAVRTVGHKRAQVIYSQSLVGE